MIEMRRVIMTMLTTGSTEASDFCPLPASEWSPPSPPLAFEGFWGEGWVVMFEIHLLSSPHFIVEGRDDVLIQI